MTKQEIFDKVWERAKTKKMCTGKFSMCSYRKNTRASCTKPATVCFVGYLIPDELYDKSIEGLGICCLLDDCVCNEDAAPLKNILKNIGIKPLQYEFLSELQRVHDDNEGNIECWESMLIKIAKKYRVKVPE